MGAAHTSTRVEKYIGDPVLGTEEVDRETLEEIFDDIKSLITKAKFRRSRRHRHRLGI